MNWVETEELCCNARAFKATDQVKRVTRLSNISKPKFSQFPSKGATEAGGRVLLLYWVYFSFVLGWRGWANTDLKKHR